MRVADEALLAETNESGRENDTWSTFSFVSVCIALNSTGPNRGILLILESERYTIYFDKRRTFENVHI